MKKSIAIFTLMLVLFTFTAFSVSAETEAPKAPESVTATSTKNSITVNWSAVENADGYRLYFKTPTAAAWNKCVSATTKTTHTFPKIAPGRTYTIAVRSYSFAKDNSVIWGAYSTVTTATQPVATAKITATQNASTIRLSWEAVQGATHYRVYQKENGNWKHLGYTTNLYGVIGNLLAGEKYTFAVRSYIALDNAIIAGEYRIIETATKLPAPANVEATATNSSVTLSWNRDYKADGYRVYFKTNEGDSWKIAVSSMTAESKKWSNLPSDTKYYLAVRPYILTSSGVVWGAYTEASAKTLSADDNSVAITDGGVKLYEITSDEAQKIFNKWCLPIYKYYEGKSSDNQTIIYSQSKNTWQGISLEGAFYDTYGNIKSCPYCGKINGKGNSDMCNGSCIFDLGN